jgi:hypothetical protein
MGTAMVYSFTGLLRRVTPKHQIFWKIFKRSCILFVLGLLINTGGCEGWYIHVQKTDNHCPPPMKLLLGTQKLLKPIRFLYISSYER